MLVFVRDFYNFVEHKTNEIKTFILHVCIVLRIGYFIITKIYREYFTFCEMSSACVIKL